MNKKYLAFLIFPALFFLASFPKMVLASSLHQDTATPLPPSPTATYVPLFGEPTQSYECNNEFPEGFGTVTPSIEYMVMCASCLPTLTPAPTFAVTLDPTQISGTATQEFLVTSTPSPIASPTQGSATETPTPSGASFICLNDFGTCSVGDNGCSVTMSASATGQTQSTLEFFFSISPSGTYPIYYEENTMISITACDYDHEYNSWINREFQAVIDQSETNSVFISYTGGATQYFENTGFLDVTHYKQGIEYYAAENWGSKIEIESQITYYMEGCVPSLSTPVPSPTPTPAPVTFCDVITEDSSLEEIEVPEIALGAPICRTWDERIIPLSWFSFIGIDLDDITIPAIQLCVQPMTLGSFVMDDITIDFDMLFYLVSVSFLVWLIFGG